MAKPTHKVYTILIPHDGNEENAKKEQYKYFQKDGETIEVPIDRFVDVPEWVAIRAKEIGLITDFVIKEVA